MSDGDSTGDCAAEGARTGDCAADGAGPIAADEITGEEATDVADGVAVVAGG